jgi:hypothetical protein
MPQSTLVTFDFPLWLFEVPDISGGEIKVLLCLHNALRHQSDGTFAKRGWLTQSQIKRMSRLNGNTVQKALDNLRERELIVAERSEAHRDTRNIYTIPYRWPSPDTLASCKQNGWKEYITERDYYARKVLAEVTDTWIPRAITKLLPTKPGFYSEKFWRIAARTVVKMNEGRKDDLKRDPMDVMFRAGVCLATLVTPKSAAAMQVPLLTPENPEGVYMEILKLLCRDKTKRKPAEVLKPYVKVIHAIEDQDAGALAERWKAHLVSLHSLIVPDLTEEQTAQPLPERKKLVRTPRGQVAPTGADVAFQEPTAIPPMAQVEAPEVLEEEPDEESLSDDDRAMLAYSSSYDEDGLLDVV